MLKRSLVQILLCMFLVVKAMSDPNDLVGYVNGPWHYWRQTSRHAVLTLRLMWSRATSLMACLIRCRLSTGSTTSHSFVSTGLSTPVTNRTAMSRYHLVHSGDVKVPPCTFRLTADNHHTPPFFRDHMGEPVPEENFWTLWCKGRLTESDTLTIRLGATPSGLPSAHLRHPPCFLQAGCPSCRPTNSVKALIADNQWPEKNYTWSKQKGTCARSSRMSIRYPAIKYLVEWKVNSSWWGCNSKTVEWLNVCECAKRKDIFGMSVMWCGAEDCSKWRGLARWRYDLPHFLDKQTPRNW